MCIGETQVYSSIFIESNNVNYSYKEILSGDGIDS